MQLIQTVAPIAEPITLTEVKEFLRILDTDSDILLGTLINVSREHIENVTNRQLESATFELYADCFITRLPKNPIQSISSIEYMDADGVYQILDISKYYLYENNGIGKISYEDLPTYKVHAKAIKITFISGYVSVPESLKQYMKVKIATLYENREEFVIGVSIAEFGNKFIENLLTPYIVRNS